MANLLSKLDGYKTYIGAAGMAGLAIYRASQGDFASAMQSAMAALTAVGLRHAVEKAK